MRPHMIDDPLPRPRRCREREYGIFISRELLARIEADLDRGDPADDPRSPAAKLAYKLEHMPKPTEPA
jgi:hypothetical protein